VGVILALVDTITDRFGTTYPVTRTPFGADSVLYYVHAGEIVVVARAILRLDKGYISDVLVYRESDRRRGIASALFDL
jgi:hypothetical protein